MNVVAGILIGWFNDFWLARLLVPLAWGVVWCVYKAIRGAPEEFAIRMQDRESPPSGSHKTAFYKIEYLTAVATSLTFSVIAGLVKAYWG